MNHDYMHTVSKELTEKAVKMLLSGATLVSEPCPYCQGVRVIKDGFALCVNCCLLYTSPSPRDLSTSRMPSSA